MPIQRPTVALATLVALIAASAVYGAEAPMPFVNDALGGTLARDHQSRAMYFAGEHRRTYLAYMDQDFNARVTSYDHDTKAWAEPVVVDDCIAEVGWCKGLKDGHNAPNLWVSKTGIVHLIYGSHGTPFKYARSTKPEVIDQWELGARLSSFATYPYVCELPDGELLMFYRYGPTGGYKNPFLGLIRSKDDGRTWSDVKKLGAFRKACKLNGRNAVYDPTSGRIHLNLALIPSGSWMWYGCQYDPTAEKMYAWDGTTELGPMPTDDPVVEHCRVDGLSLRELFVHDGVLYMLLKRGDTHSFAIWDGGNLVRHDIPDEYTEGFTQGPIWTADGAHIRMFGIRATDPPTEFSGGDLYAWTSTDGGTTWDAGTCLMDRRTLGHGLGGINLVTDYPGGGPFLVVCEATGTYPDDFKVVPENHYDNPWRKNKRIYALDEQGKVLPVKAE
ncbi:MAG: hypothetical protein GY851_11525 [bacterium]|nr:hypothetical protein [bacterium]